MSTPLAIAAVTQTLVNVLGPVTDAVTGPTSATVTARPLDKARNNINGHQLNVFLFGTTTDAAMRNQEIPTIVGRGGAARTTPPLALTLHYLITAISADDEDANAQRMLGRAMSILHDRPVLDRAAIQNALPDANLHEQVECVRFTPFAMSAEEISRLWTAFQTNYRLSTSYEASVVMIDATDPALSPLPVLKRGSDDRGPIAVAAAGPVIDTVAVDLGDPEQRLQLPARTGDRLVITGQRLTGANVQVRFANRHLTDPLDKAPDAGASATRLTISLPAELPAGIATATIVVDHEGQQWTSNEFAFPVAPTISNVTTSAPAPPFDVTMNVSPDLATRQQMSLIFGSQQLAVKSSTAATATFAVGAQESGTYPLRLRVDGVDSVPLPSTTPGQPLKVAHFDPDQQVIVP
jgi:hypothetical protein